ncbi:MAG: GNAT family N-acetyltransferase [Ferruginibacter sp.]|nr:N-acetyltransferase [Bacteroidota bacterium]MCC7378533.1 N-acetyltransferase [Chitinophagaceae bacterium]
MQIQQKQKDNKGTFYIEEGGITLAELVYTMANPQLMEIEHTEVSDTLRGQNIGYKLVHTAATFARENNIKILPLCPFAKAVMEKRKEEFKDVRSAI